MRFQFESSDIIHNNQKVKSIKYIIEITINGPGEAMKSI